MGNLRRVMALATAVSLASAVLTGQQADDSFQGNVPEQFLTQAEVRQVRDIGKGATRPKRVELEFAGATRYAVFKDIDVARMGFTRLRDGSVIRNFEDSYRFEIAAYKLDRLIGLGMVPATVERSLRRRAGSMQWWVESSMTEADRIERGVRPPDAQAWAQAVYKGHLFDQLIDNNDRHLNNILITEAFEMRLIDHSRAFSTRTDLRYPARVNRFSRSLLEAIARLEFGNLRDRLGRHLRDDQIRALLVRRDALLELADRRVAALGEETALYR